MFKVNNKHRHQNDFIDVALVPLLTLNIRGTFFYCFYCCLWTCISSLGYFWKWNGVRDLNSVKEITEIEAWLLLTFFLCYTVNQFLYILFSHIKECRCLKKVIHQIDRNEWLLLLAFQGLRQNLSWFLHWRIELSF